MQKQNAKELLEKYTAGLCSDEEKAMVENWYLTLPDNGSYPDADQIERSKKEVWDLLQVERDNLQPTQEHKFHYSRWIGVAAALLVVLGISFYFYSFNSPLAFHEKKLAVHDIAPGGNRATLILANGKKILLDSASNGLIAQESGIVISKTADGQLLYTVSSAESINPLAFNTIVTPKGGQYQVALPDGTKVWLNASSDLKFPAAFGTRGRRVELSGEAYFEVAKNALRPFKVITDKQEVEVLGTHFNINSYADEGNTKTTLLQGSVKVSSPAFQLTKILRPGQQSVVSSQTIEVKTVDIDEVMGWKNGLFIFNNENLESIMRKVSRWYNVTVEYQDESVKSDAFGGSVSRFGNVSEILRMLEITGNVRFKITPEKIIAMKPL